MLPNGDYPSPDVGPELADTVRGGTWQERKISTTPPSGTDPYAPETSAIGRLVASVRFRAMTTSSEAFAFSIVEVTGGGGMVRIGSMPISSLGAHVDFTPSTTDHLGLLAAMESTVAAMASVTGMQTTYAPHVVRVQSDYYGNSLTAAITPDSCVGSAAVSGCITTSNAIDGSDVSVTVISGSLSTPLFMRTYTPVNVTVRLSASTVHRLCPGGGGGAGSQPTFEAVRVAVLADGVDVTNIAQLSYGSLDFDVTTRTLRATTDAGSPIAVGVAGAVKMHLVVSAVSEPVKLLAEAYSSFEGPHYHAATSTFTASFAHTLMQRDGTAVVHAILLHADGTTEPVASSSLQLAIEHMSFSASGNVLTVLPVPPTGAYLCGRAALALSSTLSCAAAANVTAFLTHVTLEMDGASTCVAADGSDASIHCQNVVTTRTLRLRMLERYPNGAYETVPAMASRVTWEVTCGIVASAGAPGVFTLTLTDDSQPTCSVRARVDGSMLSNDVSVCVEALQSVEISAAYHPDGCGVVGFAVSKLSCGSSEYHRVAMTARCVTNLHVRNALSGTIAWTYNAQSSSANHPVVEVGAPSVPVSAALGSVVGGVTLTQSTEDSAVSSMTWHLPPMLSLSHGANSRYRIEINFDNCVRIDDLYAGASPWVSPSDFISGFASSEAGAVTVDAVTSELTIHGNSQSQVTLSLSSPCYAAGDSGSLWANLQPASYGLDFATSAGANEGQQLEPTSGAVVRFHVFLHIPSGTQLVEARIQLVQYPQTDGSYALTTDTMAATLEMGAESADYEVGLDLSKLNGYADRSTQPIYSLTTLKTHYLGTSSRRRLLFFDMYRSTRSAVTVQLALRLVRIAFTGGANYVADNGATLDSGLPQDIEVATVGSVSLPAIAAPSPPPPSPPPSMPPTQVVRSLVMLYEATNGDVWRNNSHWLSGEPCVNGWFGIYCCPRSLPVLRGVDECTTIGDQATGVRATQGSTACHSGNATGTAFDLGTCVIVKLLLPSNNLIGQLEDFHPLMWLPFLQHLDLSGNALTGVLPSADDCLPLLISLDLTQTRSWDDQGGITGRIPEWLLDRLGLMMTLRLANNAVDDPTAAESAVVIHRLWQRCSTLGAERCSGVPPVDCSAFHRHGQRYEVGLDGLGCVRCPTPLEILGVVSGIAGVVLLFALLVGVYTRFVRRYPEHAKTHVASFMILISHLQTLTIIGCMQLSWPLVIQRILASINLPLMGYIPLPCILADPVLKALLSYVEVAVVLLLLVGAWLVARRWRDTDGLREREAWAEYFVSVLFSLLFPVGLRASVALFARYDKDPMRQTIARLVAPLVPLFMLFLLWRFRRLLHEAQEASARAAANADAQTRVQLNQRARRAAEAVRYLTERYMSDDSLSDDRATQTTDVQLSRRVSLVKLQERARWPLRSQWQLVVWTRQGLLFLVSFAMDCVVWFLPYRDHQTARYVAGAFAAAFLGGFWRLQTKRQPYVMRRQHWLEGFLYAVDILSIVGACVYGALTRDGAAQDASSQLALELILGALLGASVLGTAVYIGFEVVRERWYIRKWYLQHGLVQALDAAVPAEQIIDAPIVAAIRDGAVRLIDCAWLLDSARSDRQLPRVTKVVAHLAADEPRSALIQRLATHCGTSSICITVEAASAASPPPSPPSSTRHSVAALDEAQLQKPSSGHITRLRHELAEADLSQLAHAIIEGLGIESVEGLREFTFDELKESLKVVAGVDLKVGQIRKLKAFLAASTGDTNLSAIPTCVSERMNVSPGTSSMGPAKALQSSAPFFAASKVAASDLPSSHPNMVLVTFHLSTFEEVTPLSAAGLHRKAEAVCKRLAELGVEGVIAMGAHFLPRCQDLPEEAFLTPEHAAERPLYARVPRHLRLKLLLAQPWCARS